MSNKTITVRWDEQDPQNEGWAYFVDGGESGPIEGVAHAAVYRIAEDQEALAGDYDAIIAAIGTKPGDRVRMVVAQGAQPIDLAALMGLDS